MNSTTKHWKIQIDWFADGDRILEASAHFDVHPEVSDSLSYAVLVADTLRRADAWGRKKMANRHDRYDERRTTITLTNGKRSRSLTVGDNGMGMSDERADECANQVMGWLLADETTELLAA